MRVHCTCGSFVFMVYVPKDQEDVITLICYGCKRTWHVKVDCVPKPECPKCHSVTFIVHTPPKGTETRDKVVFLICDECRALQQIKFGQLLEVDDFGILKGET